MPLYFHAYRQTAANIGDAVQLLTFQSLIVLSLVDKMCLAPLLLLLTHLTCTATSVQLQVESAILCCAVPHLSCEHQSNYRFVPCSDTFKATGAVFGPLPVLPASALQARTAVKLICDSNDICMHHLSQCVENKVWITMSSPPGSSLPQSPRS
jgi:hypothetical protein